jgi:multidrug efflux pump subunit AcrA (membrane-fusion protein)
MPDRRTRFTLHSLGDVAIALVWLKLAGEAALGENRPPFERQWKGALAILIAVAFAIHLWNRHRRKKRDTPEPAPAPLSPGAVPVTVPPLGEDVTEATVTRWFKKPGDRVEADDPLAELAVGKVVVEIPARTSGTLHEIRFQPGRTIPVGAVLAVINPQPTE